MNIIDVATPAGSTKKKFVDDYIRELKIQMRDNLMAISGYPARAALRTAVWTTGTRPTTDLVDGLSGVNTTIGCEEYYDLAAATWKPKVTNTLVQAWIDAIVPIGVVLEWSGSIASIPEHWHLCDGTNGTIDKRNTFTIGAGGLYAVGATGGEATHVLTVEEMPAHRHATGAALTATIPEHGDNEDYDNYIPDGGSTTGPAGGGQAHNNLPPYYASAYIQRIS